MSTEKNHPRTLTELAKVLGFSQPALSGWRKRFPAEAPADLDPEKWRAFIEDKQLGHVGNRVSESREELLRQKAHEEVRALRIKNALAERQSIPAAEVDAFLLHCASRLNNALEQLCSMCAPRVAGQEVGEARRILREHADGLRRTMQESVAGWQAEQEAARAALAEHGANMKITGAQSPEAQGGAFGTLPPKDKC